VNSNKSIQKIIGLSFPYILLTIAITGLILAFVIGGSEYTYKSLIYVIPIIIAAVYLLKGRIFQEDGFTKFIRNINVYQLIMISILLLVISLILLLVFPTRSLSYFIVISIAVSTIFLQIFTERPAWTNYLILSEIVFVSLNLIWGATLKYPLYFGDTDILGHLRFIGIVVNNGHISSNFGDYFYFPLFHIFNAIGVEVTDLPLRTNLFILNGLAYQACILFIYLIFRKLSNSTSFSLAACLLFAISQQFTFLGMYMIPRSLAFVFALCWLYLVPEASQNKLKFVFLSVIVLITLILMHHTTTLFFIPVLFIVYFCQIMFSKQNKSDWYLPLVPIGLITISFFTYLYFIADSFALPYGIQWFSEASAGISSEIGPAGPMGSVINAIHSSYILFFCLIGIGFIFKRETPNNTNLNIDVVSFASLIFLPFYVTGLLELIPSLRTALLYRFAILVSPFVIFMICFGIMQVLENGKKAIPQKLSTTAILILSGIIASFTLFSLIGGSNASDNSFVLKETQRGTRYFTDSELESFSFIRGFGDYNKVLYGDYETIRNTLYLNDFGERYILKSGDIHSLKIGYLILRTGELQKTGGLWFTFTGYNGQTFRYDLAKSTENNNIMLGLSSQNRIYTSSDIEVSLLRNK
jgi:hypothetical protein